MIPDGNSVAKRISIEGTNNRKLILINSPPSNRYFVIQDIREDRVLAMMDVNDDIAYQLGVAFLSIIERNRDE